MVKNKKHDIGVVLSALECRSKIKATDMDSPVFDGNDPDIELCFCGNCPYYYDYNGCDLKQLLQDAHDVIRELSRSKYCYTCKHWKNPDACEHWLPCQVMKTDGKWHCKDWSDSHE